MPPPITIVLASFNGAAHLPAQLDSIMAQTLTDWRLIVSDDGSTDGTQDIVLDRAARSDGRIRLIEGPGRGATANFLHLIREADPDGWIAFCDQDDVWKPTKLALAAGHLLDQPGPAVYAARTTICDEALRELAPAPHFPGPFGFRNALVQACLPGNTTVANAAALSILKQGAAAADTAGVISHDWWNYLLLAGAGARITRDPAQVVLYRQHPRNVMGRNDTARARAARASMLFDGSFADWLRRNHAALQPVRDLLLPENRELLDRFAEMLNEPGHRALPMMRKMGLYRQTRAGTVAVMAAALAGRLRSAPPAVLQTISRAR